MQKRYKRLSIDEKFTLAQSIAQQAINVMDRIYKNEEINKLTSITSFRMQLEMIKTVSIVVEYDTKYQPIIDGEDMSYNKNYEDICQRGLFERFRKKNRDECNFIEKEVEKIIDNYYSINVVNVQQMIDGFMTKIPSEGEMKESIPKIAKQIQDAMSEIKSDENKSRLVDKLSKVDTN